MAVGVRGRQEHELDSPSYFNTLEASKVVELVHGLVGSQSVDAGQADIGVIAPFRKQVLKLRQLLRARGLSAVNVGSIDDFQVAYCTLL
jgi:superfamily I DNA and/or RNA helicase